MRICEVDSCDKKHYGRGLCLMHYTRQRTHGDLTTVRTGHRYAPIDPATRLRERSQQHGECLLYTAGHPQRGGHRAMGFQGKQVGVHRIAWILANGEIPTGLSVLHRCDVPNCINPDHLFLGTVPDNNRDRDQKGRHRPLRGSQNGFAKLSEYQVIEIRELLRAGVPHKKIGDRFGVSEDCIWQIANKRTWTHVQEVANR